MIRHLARLIWNRKRANALIALEIFLSFLVLFGVALLTVTAVASYRKPRGFVPENVWVVEVAREMGDSRSEDASKRREVSRRVMDTIKGLDPVVSVSGSSTLPYSNSAWRSASTVNGQRVAYDFNRVTDDFKEALGLTLVEGRWFSKEDDGASWDPTVITRGLAVDLFGTADPIGKDIPEDPPVSGEEPGPKKRIIGVVAAYRASGELGNEEETAFFRSGERKHDYGPETFAVRVKPGTPRAFEETLVKTLNQTVREWSFSAKPLLEARETAIRSRLLPILTAGTVAAFLVLMVALGLTGILWQNVTKRRKEIGLRRATGATAGKVSLQIAMEIWIVTTLAVAAGVALVVQLPLLDAIGSISKSHFATGLGLGAVVLYVVCTVCAVYPSWLAARIPPSEALRYE